MAKYLFYYLWTFLWTYFDLMCLQNIEHRGQKANSKLTAVLFNIYNLTDISALSIILTVYWFQGQIPTGHVSAQNFFLTRYPGQFSRVWQYSPQDGAIFITIALTSPRYLDITSLRQFWWRESTTIIISLRRPNTTLRCMGNNGRIGHYIYIYIYIFIWTTRN